MKSIVFFFICLATIVVGEEDFSVHSEDDYHQVSPTNPKDPASRTELIKENADHNHEHSVKSSEHFELLNPEAEKELKSWIQNMDCSTSLMGEVKCIIVKNLSEEYDNNPEITPTMANAGIECLIGHLMAEGQVDPELDKIIHKYFKEYLDLPL